MCLALEVVIIIGILAAIALPSFLGQANRARVAEAEQYVGSVNRAQQAYYYNNGVFATTLEELEVGIPETTQSYTYGFTTTNANTEAIFSATPRAGGFPGFAGRVFRSGNAVLTVSCEGEPGQVPVMTGVDNVDECP